MSETNANQKMRPSQLSLLLLLVVTVSAKPAISRLRACATEFTSCGAASDHLHVNSVTYSPSTITKGTDVTITVNGVLDESLDASTGGKVKSKITYQGITVSSTEKPFCEAVAETKPCPWNTGAQDIKFISEVPATAPSGCYVETVTVTDANNGQVMCIKAQFQL